MKKNFIIPMTDDLMFKKMWGDPNGIRRAEALVSILLGIPYELVKGNLEIVETEKRIKNKNEKRQRSDVLLKIKLSINEKVNLEMNLRKSKSLIERNITYLAHIFSTQMKNKEDYKEIDGVIQVNFNTFYVDEENKPVIDRYYLQNEKLNKLTEKLQIIHINIERCRELCYNKGIEEYSKEEQEIIKISALMCENDKDKLSVYLGEMDMDDELKEEIEETIEEFSSNDEIMAHFNSEKDLMAIRKGEMSELREAAIKEGLEQGIQEGEKNKQIEIAKNLLNENSDVNFISRVTHLSEEEINKLL